MTSIGRHMGTLLAGILKWDFPDPPLSCKSVLGSVVSVDMIYITAKKTLLQTLLYQNYDEVFSSKTHTRFIPIPLGVLNECIWNKLTFCIDNYTYCGFLVYRITGPRK